MYKINYILVDDSAAKGSACKSFHRCVPGFGYCVVCDADISTLCRLRRRWPEAKILGVSELDTSSKHAPIRVNPEMNALRREMSDLP